MNANKKAIPGEDIVYKTVLTNTGGNADANSLKLTLTVDSNSEFKTNSVTFTDAVGGSASGLTCCASIEYSNTAGPAYTWTYSPIGIYDSNVKAIRVTPTGTLNNGV